MSESYRELLELPLEVRVEMAMRSAVLKALQENARLGVPSYFWQDGKIVEVSAEDLRPNYLNQEPNTTVSFL